MSQDYIAYTVLTTAFTVLFMCLSLVDIGATFDHLRDAGDDRFVTGKGGFGSIFLMSFVATAVHGGLFFVYTQGWANFKDDNPTTYYQRYIYMIVLLTFVFAANLISLF